MDIRERVAFARWQPGRKWYHPLMAVLVIRLSRFIMNTLNALAIEGIERFDSLREREIRGLLTFSNHVSLFDDPLIVSNFGVSSYDDVRWVVADALNFFDSPLKSWVFTAGKSVPIVRGSGRSFRSSCCGCVSSSSCWLAAARACAAAACPPSYWRTPLSDSASSGPLLTRPSASRRRPATPARTSPSG